MLLPRMRIVLTALGVIVASQAASGAEVIMSPGGQQLFISKCSVSPQRCMGDASSTCGGPYQVIDSESHAGGLLADIFPGPVSWYSMTYRCGASDGAMPAFEFRGPEYRPPSYVQCHTFGQSVVCSGN